MPTANAEAFASTPHALVPTMGALHEGHLALIRRAAEIARERNLEHVAVSIFVNPTQFNEPADYARYPRTVEADAEKARSAGATVVWVPDHEDVYPPDHDIPIEPLPPVATEPQLEDKYRPGHFAGVVQVVRRLFAMTNPAVALFGEKDWQQLQVIKAMVAAESIPTEIASVPTTREPDGLAMASRNVFLNDSERRAAAAVPKALARALEATSPADAETLMHETLRAAGLDIDYAVVRDAESLLPLGPITPALPPSPQGGEGRGEGLPKRSASSPSPSPHHARALITARAGSTRLLDNTPWTPATLPT